MNSPDENSNNPTDNAKSQDEMIEEIEAAEADGDTDLVLAHLSTACSFRERGGNDQEDDNDEEDEDEIYAWTEVAEEALDAYYRMMKSSKNTLDASTAVHHLNRLIAALGAWKEEEAIVEVALGCIVALSSKARSNQEVDSNLDVDVDVDVRVVSEAMKAFSNEATIQEQACLAIEGLALWREEWKVVFCNVEGIRDELVAAREERISNERNKAYPVRAASALGIELDGP
mmetsp:Transcript_25182/g.69446  ORF Transcript_25182/g.69446 Transcript_25182/m.69446 type:complete len:230 (+) Transcript_25182:304-993(+)|eukprot:CAMPEP_0172364742 /NCGR_PEP_ID=MMETSP1060-20121228/7796_1 /TAXON_ID=37318 /ORGANISM="Pseudo-nitzschia pungens, Strain cf. cingulata" /LENGTH=229 /DNA_ID=CAMNT_0013087817 /DNA_START=264 /DNA_END=953 /DNA_ORIENTATION=-